MTPAVLPQAPVYFALLAVWAALALLAFFYLLRRPAPYGRFAGPDDAGDRGLGSRAAWMLMEAPAVVVFVALFLASGRQDRVSLACVLLWNLHYLYRAVVYPLRLRSNRRVRWSIVGSAIVFNVVNGYLQAGYLFGFAETRTADWLTDPRFLVGVLVFTCGFAIHVWSDSRLRRLRERAGDGYRIPRGGLFSFISCPNYLGEMVQWLGWAMLTWSPAGWVFALWTAANLLPRARACHHWYRESFPDYPRTRRAVVPFVL